MKKNIEDLQVGDVIEVTTKAWVRVESVVDDGAGNAFQGNCLVKYSGATLDAVDGEQRIGSKVAVEVLE